MAFHDRPQAPVHDVPANEHQVRMLRIDEIHPSGKFRAPVMVSHMQVACQHNGKRLFKRLFRLYRQFFPVFVLVMDIAGYHDEHDDTDGRPKACQAAIQQPFGENAAKRKQIRCKKEKEQIQKRYHPRKPGLIEHRGGFDGDLFGQAETGHGNAEPQHEDQHGGQLPWPASGYDTPLMPKYIPQRQGEYDKNNYETCSHRLLAIPIRNCLSRLRPQSGTLQCRGRCR